VKLAVKIYRWFTTEPFNIQPYTENLHYIVWEILYKYDDMLPTRRPTVANDVKRIAKSETVMFYTYKKSTATLPKEDLQETETILREFVNVELYPADEYGNLYPTVLTQNGIYINLVKCEDKGLYFRIFIRINKTPMNFDSINSDKQTPKLEDDTL
jgi:hypothetical protein